MANPLMYQGGGMLPQAGSQAIFLSLSDELEQGVQVASLSQTMCLLISFTESTRPQHRQLNILIRTSKG